MPRGAIEAAVKQLLGVAGGPRTPGLASETADSTYRADDLARAAGTTVRNIRAPGNTARTWPTSSASSGR